MIKVFTGLKGFAVSLFFVAGVFLLFSIFLWGITAAIALILPVLIVISYLLIIVFVLGFLPAAFIQDLRPSLSAYSVLMSHALGVLTWMVSFFYVIKVFGFLGFFLVFLFQLLAPVAIVAAVAQGSWHIAEHLVIWTSFVYGMRFYSQWLLNLNPRQQKKGDIIDVEVIKK